MLLIAENLQITNSTVRDALDRMDPLPVRDMAKRCVAAGAEALDINSGPLRKRPEEHMRFLVETVRSVTDLPLFIDTVNPAAIGAALEAATGRVIINGFSLAPEKLEKILPLAVRNEAEIIGYLLGPDGHVPPDVDGRLTRAVELFQAYTAAGGEPSRLVIDPIAVPLSWENGGAQARAVLDVVRMLPDVLGFPVRSIVGLSNLTSGASRHKGRLPVERTYLAMLAASGLDMALVNIFHAQTVQTARTCRLITRSGVFAWEEVGDIEQ
jgi:5-methyltetrahydrofolate corrinoid/iron sulfur protein methyltransferase